MTLRCVHYTLVWVENPFQSRSVTLRNGYNEVDSGLGVLLLHIDKRPVKKDEKIVKKLIMSYALSNRRGMKNFTRTTSQLVLLKILFRVRQFSRRNFSNLCFLFLISPSLFFLTAYNSVSGHDCPRHRGPLRDDGAKDLAQRCPRPQRGRQQW